MKLHPKRNYGIESKDVYYKLMENLKETDPAIIPKFEEAFIGYIAGVYPFPAWFEIQSDRIAHQGINYATEIEDKKYYEDLYRKSIKLGILLSIEQNREISSRLMRKYYNRY